jgi:hypothetical protein
MIGAVEVIVRTSTRGVAVILAAALAASVHAQSTAPPPPQTDGDRVDQLLASSKFMAKRLEGTKQPVWIIKRKGENLKEFEVILTAKSGLLTTFITVATKDNIKRTPELCEQLLKFNYKYDSVKIGFDGDEDAYVRMDSRLRVVDLQEFNQVIEQVSSTAEALHKELQPYFISK